MARRSRSSTTAGSRESRSSGSAQAILPLCIFDGSCTGPLPLGLRNLDKPWLAIDTTGGAFDGAAYLVWVRTHLDTRRHELLVSVSKDQGRAYAPPVLLDESSEAEWAGLDELAQVAVRPDGTVDVVWNGVRDGQPLIPHASSTDGGASFSTPERVAQAGRQPLRHRPSLAVSPRGRLALCWQQARSPDRNDPRVAARSRPGAAGGGLRTVRLM